MKICLRGNGINARGGPKCLQTRRVNEWEVFGFLLDSKPQKKYGSNSGPDPKHQHRIQERINPISEWQEIEEVEGATLFELQGPPRGKITDSKVVRTYRARPLSEELTCPICLGILRETMIVMEVCAFHTQRMDARTSR